MAGKKEKQGNSVNWDLIWKVLASVFAFAGSLATVYDLIGKIRSDAQTFYAFILPGLAIIVWTVILIQLIRKNNLYVIPLLAITVLGGVVGGVGWQSYNKTQEEKVIVLVAQFDGPEEKYGLRTELMEKLKSATKDNPNIEIDTTEKVVDPTQGSEYARQLGRSEHADIVIWAWYRPTENPNITIHIENLSPNDLSLIQESETYQPSATIADLESFEIQKQIGIETANLVNFLTGYLYYQINDWKIALNLFEKVLESGENIPIVNQKYLFLYAANCNSYLGNYDSAITDYDRSIQFDPHNAAAFNNRGGTYTILGQYERAIQDLNMAVQLDPNDSNSYNTRAIIYGSLGQYERGIQDLDQAIQLNPNYATAYNIRGLFSQQLGKYDQAVQNFDQAIRLDPNYVFAYNDRAVVYRELGQYDQAILDFDQAIQLDLNFVDAYINRGDTYMEVSKYDLAIKDFNRAIQLDPNHAQAFRSRATIYHQLGQYKLAIQDLDQAIQLDPNYAESYYNRGFAYNQLGEYQAAIPNLDQAIRLDPNTSNFYYERGFSYNNLGQYDRAIQDFSQAIHLDPDLISSYQGRGVAYQKLGKTGEAEADFKKYEELTGEKP